MTQNAESLLQDKALQALVKSQANLPEKANTLRGSQELSVEDFSKQLSYQPLDYDQGMPWAVFSNPQVAGIGPSEDQLIAAGQVEGRDYVKGLNWYKNSAMGDARMSDHG